MGNRTTMAESLCDFDCSPLTTTSLVDNLSGFCLGDLDLSGIQVLLDKLASDISLLFRRWRCWNAPFFGYQSED
jgi:hypothetical protein